MSTVENFIDFVCSAARLRREFVARQRTLNSLKIGKIDFVLYAVDTDIVKTYANPALTGPTNLKTGGDGYGQVFSIDSTHDATAIAAALGSFVFYHLSDKFPLIQLPGHYDETQIVYDGVARDAGKELAWNRNIVDLFSDEKMNLTNHLLDLNEASILSFRGIFANRNISSSEQESEIENNVDELIDLVLGRSGSHNREYTKYLKLLAEGCLLSIDNFSSILSEETDLAELADALKGPSTLQGWAQEASRVEFWLKIISEKKSDAAKKYSIEADARATARLEYVNDKIVAIGGRLILITGDGGLREAIQDGNAQLAADCVRDPRSYLVESFAVRYSEPGTSSAGTLDAWLNGILADYTDSNGLDLAEIDDLIAKKPSTIAKLKGKIETSGSMAHNGIYDAIVSKWQELKKPIIIWNLAYSDEMGSQFRELLLNSINSGNKSELEKTITELKNAARIRIDQVWSELLIAFTSAGVGLLLAIRENDEDRLYRSRNSPIIRFDSFPIATKLALDLAMVRTFNDLDPPLSIRLKELGKDTFVAELGNTDFAYLNCLVFATLCAAEGKWFVARGLAQYAISIAESGHIQTKEGSNISGREAYYLSAISTRLISSNPENFANVRSDLESARSALRRDHDNNTAKSIKGYRFDAEGLATDLAEIHFALWLKKGEQDSIERAPKLFVKVLELIDKLSDEQANEPSSEKVIQSVVDNLYVNALQISHIAIATGNDDFLIHVRQTKQRFVDLRIGIDQHSIIPFEFHKTYLIESYLIFSDCLFDLQKISKKDIEIHFSDYNIEKYSVIAYDKRRFLSLKNSCLGEVQVPS